MSDVSALARRLNWTAPPPRLPNPTRKQWLMLGGAAAVAAAVGGYMYTRRLKPSELPGPQAAVRKAMQMLPGSSSVVIADTAYVMAYPNCPPKLDPDDPSHTDCIAKWLQLQDMAIEEMVAPTKKPKPRPKPSGGAGPSPEPEPPPDVGGPAADMKQWLDSLSSSQSSGLRRIIGGNLYDPIAQAAESGDNGATVTAVLRLKRAIERLAESDPVKAFKQYSALQKLLGPKLDKLLRMAKKYG